MIDKKWLIIALISLIGIFSLSQVLADSKVSYCCEKTLKGAWCQDSSLSNCDVSNGLRTSPSSCEVTSYCKLGTCIDGSQGDCKENVPQKVCNDNGGVWDEKDSEEIPQCQLGCCLIGDQAAFVTQVKCKQLSSLYGLETNYRKDIKDQFQCIASATSEAKGACVFEQDFEKTCQMTTKKECQEKTIDFPDANVEFHEGFLCSAEELGTNCGKTSSNPKTTCVAGKDEVYFVDTCGNLANVYDASKVNNPEYWTYIKDKSESCSSDSSNANSASCGNCDYYLGSTCSAVKRGETAIPTYGDYICRDLSCKYNGQTYQHGETWCASSGGVSSINATNKVSTNSQKENVPGSSYSRLTCYDGEVSAEACNDFRQEVCIQSQTVSKGEIFRTATCSANLWQDCTAQNKKAECENRDKRDCKWIPSPWHPNQKEDFSSIIQKDEDRGQYGSCTPLYSPGFDFSGAIDSASQEEGASLCNLADTRCIVTWEKGLFDKVGDIIANSECAKGQNDAWLASLRNMCVSLGDCGNSVNYIGKSGYKGDDVQYQSDWP